MGSVLNIAHNNSILLIVVLAVCLFAFAVCLPGNLIPEKFYPLVILTISFCLLFQVLWLSPYIMGNDSYSEYFVFELVAKTGHWSQNYPNLYEQAISVTILPAIVQTLISADGTAIFKAMYPLAFSLVPVIMYQAYRYIVDSKRAFLSAVLLMSYSSFFQTVSFIGKEEIAQVIFCLLLLFIYKGRSGSYAKSFVMLLLIAGLTISHYSSAYVFGAYVLLSLPIGIMLKMKRTISSSFVATLGLLAIAWTIYTAQGIAFNRLAQLGYQVYEGTVSQFFNSASREPMILKAFGVGVTPSPVNSIDLLVYYVIQFFIVVGLVRLWKQRKSLNTRNFFPSRT